MKKQELFERAQRVIPGGVNSPVRAFRAVGGTPPFFERASGAYLWDVEGKRYIDYVGSWGPMLAGHTHPDVLGALRAAESGLSPSARPRKVRSSSLKRCAVTFLRWKACASSPPGPRRR